MTEKSKKKENKERRQPKFDKTKTPPSEKGEGLAEYVSDEPNLKPGDQKKKKEENQSEKRN